MTPESERKNAMNARAGFFRPKNTTVMAIFFDGANKDEVQEFTGAKEHHRGGDGTTVWIGGGVHLMAHPHYWIVKRGDYWQMEGSDFERDYEPADA